MSFNQTPESSDTHLIEKQIHGMRLKLSEDDKEARLKTAENLWQISVSAIKGLEELQNLDQETFEQFCRTKPDMPVSVGFWNPPNYDLKIEKVPWAVKKILSYEIGKDLPFPLKKLNTWRGAVIYQAYEAIMVVREPDFPESDEFTKQAKTLPEFSPDSIDEWKDVIVGYIVNRYGDYYMTKGHPLFNDIQKLAKREWKKDTGTDFEGDIEELSYLDRGLNESIREWLKYHIPKHFKSQKTKS